MTRKPDDVKKGLECCEGNLSDCELCPYREIIACQQELKSDALALIQQLHAENAQLNRCIENLTDKLNAMNDEVAKLQAERDAAVESMRKDPHCCFHCKHKGKWPSCNSDPRPNGSCFEWRGVTKEE